MYLYINLSLYILHVFDINYNDAEIYFRRQKLYTSHIYFIFMGVRFLFWKYELTTWSKSNNILSIQVNKKEQIWN